MSETRIEWTDATRNPVAGCSVLTTGCTHCYAMAMAKRLEAMGIEKYAGLTQIIPNPLHNNSHDTRMRAFS